jgi:hypothetical protein
MNMAMQENIQKYNKLNKVIKRQFKRDMRLEIQLRMHSVLS